MRELAANDGADLGDLLGLSQPVTESGQSDACNVVGMWMAPLLLPPVSSNDLVSSST